MCDGGYKALEGVQAGLVWAWCKRRLVGWFAIKKYYMIYPQGCGQVQSYPQVVDKFCST